CADAAGTDIIDTAIISTSIMATSAAGSRFDEAIMAQKRVELRRAPAKGDERFERRARAAHREDRVAKPGADRGRHDTGLLEEAERVGGHHLGPQVAVVPGRVL